MSEKVFEFFGGLCYNPHYSVWRFRVNPVAEAAHFFA